jgi:cell wall-associated NlpC family hydrolase
MIRSRRLLVGVTAAGIMAATFVPFVASADPVANPGHQPSVADVQKQLSALAVKNAQLIEQYDQVQILVGKRDDAAKNAQGVAQAAADNYDTARSRLAAAAAAQYEGGAFSSTGALLASSSENSYLEQLQTLNMISSHRAEVVATLTAARAAADASKQAAKQALADAQAKLADLKAQQQKVEDQLGKYKDLLGTLTAKQQAAYENRINPKVSSSTLTRVKSHVTTSNNDNASAAAIQAVKYALDQVGKPYSYGSAGPDSYDCSGLTMASYASAGISLPHSAAEQSTYGKPVSMSDLIPGDLLFYYSPIGHVTIYVGGGMMVSAPQTGESVLVMPVNNMSGFVGAVRIAP